MADKVFLHIGLPKSGTTYVQAVLGDNKERLRDRAGLLYPGRVWADQVHAARDVLSAHPHGSPRDATHGAWDRLVEEITAWDGNAVVSMEWLGSASPEQARRMVDTLSPATTEIVVTARDLGRTVPAAWQEFVQNWERWTWPEFLRSISSETPRGTPAGNLFWLQQDLGRLLAVWGDVVPVERIHVVTLPRPGSTAGELWNRFASVLGIEAGVYDASGGGGNESLGLESVEMMRRLNDVCRLAGVEWSLYDDAFKHVLAKGILAKRKGLESTLAVPEEYHDWVRARAEEMKTSVRAAGVHVVGDLDDLDPVFPSGGIQPDEISTDALLEAALEGLVGLGRARERVRNRLRAVEERPAPTPVKTRILELGDRNAAVGRALDVYRAGRRTVTRRSP